MKSKLYLSNAIDKLFIFLKTFQGKTVVGVMLFFVVLSLTYTNCARTNFVMAKNAGSANNFCVINPNDPSCQQQVLNTCNFNGQTLQDGQSVTAYLNSNGTCTSETRVCTNGSLSGSYNYATCNPSAPASCLFNGQTISSGQSVTAYLAQTSPAGTACDSQTRTCTDGVLSGSYAYGSCTNGTYDGCLFNGVTYAHGQSVTAYLASTVSAGQTCQSQTRTCMNGVLSGTYNFGSCTVGQPASCTFNGQTIASGQTVQAYLASTVPTGQTCQQEARTCTNGVLSGTYTFATCNVNQPASCTFNGQTIAHGGTVQAYLNSSVNFGGTCAQETRTCNNGNLSGSYAYANCSVTGGANCLFNGQTIAHGQSVPAYLNSSVNFDGTCTGETRTCNNGNLSGSYSFASCSVGQAASCNFNGQNIPHNGSVTAYSSSSVATGLSCVSQTRTCNNGALSGSFAFSSCSVNQPASCLFNGQTIPNGGYVTAYATANVAYGETCASENRYCQNGNLSGSYMNRTCVANQALSCYFNGQNYPHGQSLTMYSAPTAASSTTCAQLSTVRTCNNGQWTGSVNYFYPSCTQANNSCNFNGQSIAHGGQVLAYETTSVAFGQTCSGQYRTCNNGTLSGSFAHSSCSAQNPASCGNAPSALACTIYLKCPDGRQAGVLEGQNVVGTIGGVAHGQYGYIIGLSNGYAATRLDNIRYQCNNGQFNWSPTGPTWCGGSSTLPATDRRCFIFWDGETGPPVNTGGGANDNFGTGDGGGGCGVGGDGSGGSCGF